MAHFFPTHFFPPLFRSVALATGLMLLLSVSQVSAAGYMGPVFPEDDLADMQFAEPLPLPKQSPLLQRPRNKQVVFDGLDPLGSVVPRRYPPDGRDDFQPSPVIHRQQTPSIVGADTMSEGMSDFSYEEIIGEYPMEMGSYVSGPICHTFGMGLFDNLTLFAEKTTYKTGLDGEAGSFGFSEGINWATPVTPHGTITAQCGVRAVQGDVFSHASRHQTFVTAGIFKRFDFFAVQGGVAVDWLHDHSRFGSVNVRQMRAELSARTFRGLEYGFMGGFDVFRDRPTTPAIDRLVNPRRLPNISGAVDVQDYYLLFIRKHLNHGGKAEFRCGATARGDLLVSILGEAAITDKLAVNGGMTLLAPSEGQSARGNYRESWSMSLGVVLYFRGGAMSQQANLYRPMFDVAGNNSFFHRIVRR
jgi:hypothetical protein